MSTRAFQEYLELYSYFGRGGLVRLTREQFEPLAAEFDDLVRDLATLSDEQKDRLRTLKLLLLRDRPRL